MVIARLMSTAGTGFMYTTRRLRVAERLSLMKYDPVGTWFFFFFFFYFAVVLTAVKRHVLFKEVKGKK